MAGEFDIAKDVIKYLQLCLTSLSYIFNTYLNFVFSWNLVFGLETDTGKCVPKKQYQCGSFMQIWLRKHTNLSPDATDQPKVANSSWPSIMRLISQLQTHGGKQTIENVQMIQLAAKLWRQKKGFEEYGEKALKVHLSSKSGFMLMLCIFHQW